MGPGSTELTQQRLYDTQMNLVQRYWEDYHHFLLQQMLMGQLPSRQGGIDRRGFEWFYWRRKLSSGFVVPQGDTRGDIAVAFSPDLKRLALTNKDGTVRMCDIQTGQNTLTIKGAVGRA